MCGWVGRRPGGASRRRGRGARLPHVRHHGAKESVAPRREPVQSELVVVEALGEVRRYEEEVGLARVESAVRRAQQPAVHLRIERVQVRLVPAAGHAKVGREPDVELRWQVVDITRYLG